MMGNRANIDQINPEMFEFLSSVHFLKDFQYKSFRDLFCFQIATWLIFELRKSFDSNVQNFVSEHCGQKCV